VRTRYVCCTVVSARVYPRCHGVQVTVDSATLSVGRAIAQAVSCRLPTAAARVQTPGLVMWDFVMDKSGVGSGFLRELRFPLPIYITSASPQSSSLSPEAGTIGHEWPQCQ
jgi:hypothetical protein